MEAEVSRLSALNHNLNVTCGFADAALAIRPAWIPL